MREAEKWIRTVGQYVAIRDCLALSFALDYRTEGGDPAKNKTQVGDLCRRAKPYGENAEYDKEAARELARLCSSFLREMTCYKFADCVVAMPPSRQKKPFDLPRYLAQKVASTLEKEHLSDNVRTVKGRRALKDLRLEDKLDELKGTVEVDEGAFQGKRVLIVDDLYQSGVSVNYVGMLLLEAGAKKIFGLACEKTSRNDANLE
ncbi:MAG: hypothetical protein HY648_06540 [Acidobacteria bacterium]|nr:hypothetical protein [Acidobacteriota bacterium]